MTTKNKLDEQAVINAIVREHWSTSICLQRFTPKGWWECDVFMMTKSNYFYEYEIKLSRSDFFHDLKKSRQKYNWATDDRPFSVDTIRKHGQLEKADPKGPAVFYYVAPSGMVKAAEIPKYAGLIEIFESDFGIGLRNAVRAPRIHKTQTDDTVRDDIMRTCYYRMHQYLQQIRPNKV